MKNYFTTCTAGFGLKSSTDKWMVEVLKNNNLILPIWKMRTFVFRNYVRIKVTLMLDFERARTHI